MTTRILIVSIAAAMLVSLIGDAEVVRLSAVGWITAIGVTCAIAVARPDLPVLRHPVWLPWMVFVIVHALASRHTGALLRCAILVAPVAVGMVAAALPWTREDVRMLVRTLRVVSIGFLLIVAVKYVIRGEEMRNFFAVESISAVLLAWIAFHVALFFRSRGAIVLWALLALPPVVTASRTATAVLALSLVASLAPMRVRARATLFLTMLCLGAGVAMLPNIQSKTLRDDASISDIASDSDLIETSGRAFAWTLLAERLPDAPIAGHGANSSQTLLRAMTDRFDHPHNDWLRVAYEYGALGVVLLVLTIGVAIRRMLAIGRGARSPEEAFVAYAGASLFVPFMLVMITDNVLLYAAFFGNVHFLLMGAACSMAARRDRTAASPSGAGTSGLAMP